MCVCARPLNASVCVTFHAARVFYPFEKMKKNNVAREGKRGFYLATVRLNERNSRSLDRYIGWTASLNIFVVCNNTKEFHTR